MPRKSPNSLKINLRNNYYKIFYQCRLIIQLLHMCISSYSVARFTPCNFSIKRQFMLFKVNIAARLDPRGKDFTVKLIKSYQLTHKHINPFFMKICRNFTFGPNTNFPQFHHFFKASDFSGKAHPSENWKNIKLKYFLSNCQN